MRTPLVISFSGTLRSMARGRVTSSDLDGAIFYLGCTEAHAKDEDAALQELQGCVVDNGRQMEVYAQLRQALDEAEAQGRVGYHHESSERPNSWECLNALLASNGLGAIVPVDNDYPAVGRYNYPAVVMAVREQDLPYEVIWVR